jgi:hypothetical protein
MKYDKYKLVDWGECQRLYDTGLSWRNLLKNGYSCKALVWAVKNRKLKMRANGESQHKKHSMGLIDYSPWRTKSFRKKMSKIGGYRKNSGRCKHIQYKGVDIQGTWELKFVEFLDSKDIKWERNKVGYKYLFEDKERQYYPDFFLPQYNLYVEVKGYETNKDKAKWKQFPFELLIVRRKEIFDLEMWFQNNL